MANDFFRMVLWWCGMTEVLLFSDDEKIFNLTNSVIENGAEVYAIISKQNEMIDEWKKLKLKKLIKIYIKLY